MFILNYQRLSDEELRSDSNFRMVLNTLYQNSTLESASLIGATHKPMGLGFIFHIYFRLQSGSIVRAEAHSELYSNKVTVRQIFDEDFTSNLM